MGLFAYSFNLNKANLERWRMKRKLPCASHGISDALLTTNRAKSSKKALFSN